MDYGNFESINNNAGNYSNAVIGKAVDGNLDTYWETNKGNTSTFSNEVEVTFKDLVTLDRVMYGARKSDRKGFAEEFEIYVLKPQRRYISAVGNWSTHNGSGLNRS